MLSFFRRIRRNLLGAGSGRQYLQYAFGEVLLVMIGILLALQVNNWNEERKDRRFERKILLEIKEALSNDIDFFDILFDRIDFKERSIYNLLDRLNSSKPLDNREFESLLSNTGWDIKFSIDAGAYESLKSIGLDKIQDDSLRTHLVNMYEVHFPRYEDFVDGDDLLRRERRVNYLTEFLTYKLEKDESGQWNSVISGTNPNLIKDDHFNGLIQMEINNVNYFRGRIGSIKERTVELYERLVEYLNE